MRRMWQKYTPGKRVLALLLAVIMMLDPFAVSAATTEDVPQEVGQEVVVEDLVEVGTTEAETEVKTEVEIETEEEPAVVEPENEENKKCEEVVTVQAADTLSDTAILLTDDNWYHLYYPNVVNYYMASNMSVNSVNLCVRLDPNEVDTSIEPVVTVESDGGWFNAGQEVPMYGYNLDENGYLYYNRYLTGGGTEWPYDEFEYGVLTVTLGDVTRKFTLARADLQYTVNGRKTEYFICNTTAGFAVGDEVSLVSKNHAPGAFGYMTISDGGVITVSDITDAEAKSAWDANYAATYGAYGADGKYYCFTYGTDNAKTWLPKLGAVKAGSATIQYYSLNAVGDMQDVEYSVSVFPNYTVKYEDVELMVQEDGTNKVPYSKGDLRFYVYKDGAKVNTADATVSIDGFDGTIEEALSVKSDENNYWYIEIDAEKVRDYDDNVVGLEKSPYSKNFAIEIIDTALASSKNYYYTISPAELQIQKESGAELFLENETVEVDFSEPWMYLALPVDSSDTRYVNPTITYSDASVLELSPESGDYSYGRVRITPKKLGTTKVTISYMIDEVKETYTANIKLVSNKELEFGIWDMNDYAFLPFVDDVMTAEMGIRYEFFTNISPMLLSDITVTSADPSIFFVYGNISESYFEQNGETMLSRSYALGEPRQLGVTKVTFSAKYNGKTVTQTVSVMVKEARGVSVKQVRVDNWSDDGYVIGNKVTNVGIDNSNRDILYAICDDVVVGTDESGNPVYENTYADKDNYDIIVVDKWTNEPSDYFTIKFINKSIFTIVPNEEKVTNSVYNQILRITSKTDNTKKADVQLNYNMRAMLYESYADGKLSGPIEAIPVVEGTVTSVYLEVGAGANINNLSISNLERYGVTAQTKVVEASETRMVVELEFTYAPYGSDVGYFYTYINAGNYENSTDAYIYPMKVTDKYVPGFSQRAISDFYRAEDDSKDIPGGMRYGEYEYAFRTINGKKVAIVVGYLGDGGQAFVEKSLQLPIIVDAGNSYISVVQTIIPIIGVEDGAFDTRNGYTEPDIITLFAGHTYFGKNQSGLVNPNGGRVLFDWWQGEAEIEGEQVFSTYNGMLFVEQQDGSYKCVDTGNLSVAPIILDSVTLYTNSPMPRDVIALRKSSNVSGYKLAGDYLLTEEGAQTLLKVAVENDSYVVSTDSGAAVTAGTYYLMLTPQKWINALGGSIDLPTISVKVVVNTKNEAPVVTMNNEITMNKYLGKDAIVLLGETNSFGTATTVSFTPESAAKAAELGLSLLKNGDNKTLLYWDAVDSAKLPKGKLEFEVQFEVEGFTPSEGFSIPNQKLTINVIDEQPQTTVSANKLTFTNFPYEPMELNIGIRNGFVNNNVKDLIETAVSVPKGVDLWEAYSLISFVPNVWNYNTVQVCVHNDAEPGIYEFEIAAVLNTESSHVATPIKVTVEVKGTKPALQFNGKVNVTLDAVHYNTDVELPSLSLNSETDYVSVYDGAGIAVKSEMVSKPKTATDSAVVIRAIYEDELPENGEWLHYEVGDLNLVADVEQNAPAGTYKLNVKVPLNVNGDVVYSKVPVSVKVVNKIPTFKLSSSTVTLDGSMIGNPESTQLMLDAGYTLAGIEYEHPTVEAEKCLDIGMRGDGKILFTMMQSGMSKNATYKITPLVETANGELIKLKPVSITVKVTYSNKMVLSAKTKTININPYIGAVVVDPQFTVKNAQNVMFYDILPTSETAKNTEMQVTIDAEGKIHVSNCENVVNGKYTYNVVQHNEGGFTKPVTITLNVARKALNIKPENSKPTLYADYCNGFEVQLSDDLSLFYIIATFPVEIDGAENLNLVDYLAKDETGLNATNDLYEDWAILTYFEETTEGETSLIVAIPYGITPNNIVITPSVAEGVNKEFAKLKMNITVKAGKPTIQFEEKSVTLNRFATDNVTNVIADTEGYLMYGMSVDSITLKGKTENVRDLYFEYDNTSDRNSVNIKIKPDCVDTIPNGTYVVTATPNIAYVDGYDENGEPYVKPAIMNPCTFEIKVEDTKAAITISEKNVNLYPELGGANTATVIVSAKSGNTELGISAVEANTNGKATVTDTEGNNSVTFTVAEGTAKGSNKYDITVSAKRYGGSKTVEIGNVKNAVTVNVKPLPATLKMTSTKLKFNPYLQTDVTMEVADKEIKEMIASGDCRFTISNPVETDSTYQKLVPQLNDVLVLETSSRGTIVVTAKALPTAKATYYYSCVYTLHNVDGTGGYKNYDVKFSVTVDTVKPTAQVSAKSVTLDNAKLEQNAYSDITLKTGAGVWNMVDINQNYKVIDSKKNDVTDKFAVSVIYGQIAIAPRAYDQGNPVEVPKGNYTLSVVPVITNGVDTLEIPEVKVTVKVTSSRPTYVKNSATLTVNTWTNSRVAAQVTLKSGESFVQGAQIVCTKAPRGVEIKDGKVAGLTIGFEVDGTLWAQADRNVVAGNYTVEVKPVADVNGYNMILDPLKVTVKVDTKQPKAVVSDKAVATVNKSYTGYSKDLTISLAGAEQYAFGFTKADIATKETNAAKKADAEKLLDAMAFTVENGLVTINVNLNGVAASVAKGTYKFVIKDATVKSGNYMSEEDEAYKVGDINFSVKVEDTKAKVTAKATGTIDLLKRDVTDVNIQLSFNKQNYEAVDKITGVRILEGNSDYDSYQFYVSDDSELVSGKFTVEANGWSSIAAKNQQVTVEVTTESGNTYTAKVTLKVTQSNIKITAAKSATYFATANIAEIPVAVSDEAVSVGDVRLTSAKIGAKKLDVSDFSCNLGYYNGQMIQLQSDNDLSEYAGKTMTCIFEVEPSGMASNKKPTKVTVNILIR